MLQKASLKLQERNVDFLICGDQMKRLLIPLLAAITLPTAVNAETICTITSEIDKDVVIKIEGDSLGMFGRITYKEKPMYRISFFHMNGYGGHRYTLSEDKDPDI